MEIRIRVGKQKNGVTYELDPETRAQLWDRFSGDLPPSSSVFVSHDTKENFETVHGSIQNHVAGILTGLSSDEIDRVEVIFEDAETSTPLSTA
jgi:type III secretory pathway lipoprotein EscJ